MPPMPGNRAIVIFMGHECGAIAFNMAAIVVGGNPKEKPSFSRISCPADLY
jgi:hypothetical protein